MRARICGCSTRERWVAGWISIVREADRSVVAQAECTSFLSLQADPFPLFPSEFGLEFRTKWGKSGTRKFLGVCQAVGGLLSEHFVEAVPKRPRSTKCATKVGDKLKRWI